MFGRNLPKKIGQSAGIVTFVIVMVLSLIHEGFASWTVAMDNEYFGGSHSRYQPTVVIVASVVALIGAGIGYLVGFSLDKRGRDK